ncbi:MAG: Hsp33 family molecular chaperone [Hyphomicrobiaceae bacterium]|nr:Hsp33 family molecular chaperone [Hyphomicrobiaceae bacterium]
MAGDEDTAASAGEDGAVNSGSAAKDGGSAAEDIVLPFRTLAASITGRLVRLGPAIDTILSRHDYPLPVATALGEAIALVALIGAGLKFEGRLVAQTKTDGPLGFLVADYTSPGHLRGYAGFEPERVSGFGERLSGADQARLLGKGHLAFTIDPGGDMQRYQGIVALDGQSLSAAADAYFRQSEQLPTFIRLAVGRIRAAGANHEDGRDWRWRAGGIMLQHLATSGGIAPAEAEGEPLPLTGDDDEDWQRNRILAATVESHELVDPSLSPERLLVRLFHEEGVAVEAPVAVHDRCRCSRERVIGFLSRFETEGDLDDLRTPDGGLEVTCEFCSTVYRFAPGELQ